MSQANAAVSTERLLSASPRTVFAAFQQPDRLARWWGPSGFMNTFQRFEFEPGRPVGLCDARPQLRQLPQRERLREIEPDTRIVIEHVVKPGYRLTVTLAVHGDEPRLGWVQEFESPEMAAKTVA